MNWVFLLSVFAGLTVIGLAIAQYFKEQKDEETRSAERLADKNEIIKLQKEGMLKMETINHVQSANIELLQEQNITLKKITLLQAEIHKYQTGGDNIPKLRISILPATTSLTRTQADYIQVDFDVLNPSDYPLVGVTGMIEDSESWEMRQLGLIITRTHTSYYVNELGGPDSNSFEGNFPFSLGTITKGNTYPIHTATIIINENNRGGLFPFNIFLQWNNGSIKYDIFSEMEDGVLKIKNVVVEINGEKIDNSADFYEILIK